MLTADQLEREALAALDAMEAKFGAPSWQHLVRIPGALPTGKRCVVLRLPAIGHHQFVPCLGTSP